MKLVFRLISILEGVSYLLLLFIATPIKYFAGDPTYVKLLGMPHGLLFIAYIILAIFIKKEMGWKGMKFVWILIASIIPFGTLYVDKRYLR
jgi:integral membrane protein